MIDQNVIITELDAYRAGDPCWNWWMHRGSWCPRQRRL